MKLDFDGDISSQPISRAGRWIFWLTAAYIVVMLLSLKLRFLDYFVPTTWHGRIGFDYFSVPRSFLNLLHHKSIYNTRFSDFGPYATWYPYHPALSVLLGSWLSLFKPWASYAVFVAFSLGVLFYSGRLLAQRTRAEVLKQLSYFLVFCSLPVYLMLWNGQMHVLIVLAFTLILVDLLDLNSGAGLVVKGVRVKLFAGIMISLLSKPVVLPALLAVFAVRQCRKTVIASLVSYAAVSLLFWVIPALNPQPVRFGALLEVILNPQKIWRSEVYRGVPLLSYRPEFVYDNSIHWINMKMHLGTLQPGHFEIMSLSSFTAAILGINDVPAWLMLPKLILLAALLLPYWVEEKYKPDMVLFAVMLSVACFYLAYDTVYEYHYAVLQPLVALILILYHSARERRLKLLMALFCAAGALLYVPTPYFWFRNPDFGHHSAHMAGFSDIYIYVFTTHGLYAGKLAFIRLFRVAPALLMFAALAGLAAQSFALARRRG